MGYYIGSQGLYDSGGYCLRFQGVCQSQEQHVNLKFIT